MFYEIFSSGISDGFVGKIESVFDKGTFFSGKSSMSDKKINVWISVEFCSEGMNNCNNSRNAFLFVS
jgi:hypothetical protein